MIGHHSQIKIYIHVKFQICMQPPNRLIVLLREKAARLCDGKISISRKKKAACEAGRRQRIILPSLSIQRIFPAKIPPFG